MSLKGVKIRHNMWRARSVRRDYRVLATFFNIEIRSLPDRSLTEIEENVNGGVKNGSFGRYRLRTEQIWNVN